MQSPGGMRRKELRRGKGEEKEVVEEGDAVWLQMSSG